MYKSWLEILQDAADEVGVNRTLVSGNSGDLSDNSQARQLYSIGHRTIISLKREHDWERMIKQGSIAFVLDQLIYDLPSDFLRFRSDTMWDRDNNRKVNFPIDSVRWAHIKGWVSNVEITRQVRLYGGHLHLYQAPTLAESGQELHFEYVSKNIAGTDIDNLTLELPSADATTVGLPADLVSLGIIWRYRKAKGYEWQDYFREYNKEMQAAKSQEVPHQALNMGTTLERYIPTPQNRDYGYG